MRKGTRGRHTTPPTKPRQSGVPFYHPPVLKHSSGTTRRRQYQGHYTVAPCCGPNKTAPAAVLHGSMFSKPCASAQGRVPCARAAAQAAALRLLYHISKFALRITLVFTKKYDIYAAKRILHRRLVFAKRTYYTTLPALLHRLHQKHRRRPRLKTRAPVPERS